MSKYFYKIFTPAKLACRQAEAGIQLINAQVFTPAMAGFQEVSIRHPLLTSRKLISHFAKDSLYRNSIYLMASTAVMAFFGFFFWIISARLYSPEEIGIATTLLSVMGLIAGFSILGLNVGLIRFLPRSKNPNALINSGFLITSVTALILSILFLLGIEFFSPALIFIRQNLFYSSAFAIFVVMLSNNTIADSLFIAYRSAKYTLLKNSVFSFGKLVLALLLTAFGAFGIFLATGIAYALIFFLSLAVLMKVFKYDIRLKQNFGEIRKIAKYSFGNYVAGFIGGLPAIVLPIIITNQLGARETAYFYIAFMIASLIFIIPQATTQSLFAEGSHSEKDLKQHILKAGRLTGLILLPAILVIVLLGNLILGAFGKSYSDEAFRLLQLFTLSSIFMAVNNIMGTILRVKNNVNQILIIGFISTVIIFFLTYIFLGMGLLGIGVAWLAGQAVNTILYLFFVFRKK